MSNKMPLKTAVKNSGTKRNGANTPTMPQRPPMPKVQPPKPSKK